MEETLGRDRGLRLNQQASIKQDTNSKTAEKYKRPSMFET